jgi:hypothetical protein
MSSNSSDAPTEPLNRHTTNPVVDGYVPIKWDDIPEVLKEIIRTDPDYEILNYNPRSQFPQEYKMAWALYPEGTLDFGIYKRDPHPEELAFDAEVPIYFDQDYHDPETYAKLEAAFRAWHSATQPTPLPG